MSIALSAITLNPDKNAILVIGDSITAANILYQKNETTKANWCATSEFGPESWMQAFLKEKRFKKTHFRGRSGIQAAEIVNGTKPEWTIAKIAASSDAETTLIGIGTNDITNGRTAQQVHDDVVAIAEAFENRLMRVCVKSIFPRLSTNPAWTADAISRTLKANDLLRETCSRRGWSFINIASAITDYTNLTTWIAKPDTLVDLTHPNNYGAMRIGKILADFFASRRDTNDNNIFHFRDGYSFDATSRQLVVNPLHNTGWSFISTFGGVAATSSTVAHPNGFGNASQYVVNSGNAAANSTTAYQNISSAPLYVAGMSIEVGSSMLVDNGTEGVAPVNVICPNVYVETTDAVSGTRGGAQALRSPATIGKAALDIPLDVQLVSPPMRFTGEETNRTNKIICGMNALANSVFRVRIFDSFVRIGASPYTQEMPCYWTDSDTPIKVY